MVVWCEKRMKKRNVKGFRRLGGLWVTLALEAGRGGRVG